MKKENKRLVPNITSPSKITYLGDWVKKAACQTRADVFFPEGNYSERAGEQEAKSVCHSCLVVDECFIWGSQGNDISVMGGANRWERHWFKTAPEEELEEVETIYQIHGRAGAQKIKAYIEETGMPGESMEGQSTKETSGKFAIPVTMAKDWQEKAGVFVSSKYRNKNKVSTKS